MPKLIISTNDPREPRVTEKTTFYFTDYEMPGPLVARMLTFQQLVDYFNLTIRNLSERRMAPANAVGMVEELWRGIEETLSRFDGGTADKKPSEPASAAPTSTPSPNNSSKKESSSSTKRKGTRSSSRQAAATSAASASQETK